MLGLCVSPCIPGFPRCGTGRVVQVPSLAPMVGRGGAPPGPKPPAVAGNASGGRGAGAPPGQKAPVATGPAAVGRGGGMSGQRAPTVAGTGVAAAGRGGGAVGPRPPAPGAVGPAPALAAAGRGQGSLSLQPGTAVVAPRKHALAHGQQNRRWRRLQRSSWWSRWSEPLPPTSTAGRCGTDGVHRGGYFRAGAGLVRRGYGGGDGAGYC